MELSARQQKVFEEAKATFEAALLSPTYMTWFDRAAEDFDFYYGNQWKQEHIDVLTEAGLQPATMNMISHRLDALAGQEVRSRTRFKYRSRSGNPTEVKTAEALSQLSFFVQDKNRSSSVLTEAKHHARICGMGWHGFEIDKSVISEFIGNPLETVWDVRDRTQDLRNQGFVARIIYKPMEEAKRMFPKAADELDAGLNGTHLLGSAFDFTRKTSASSARLRMVNSGGYYDNAKEEIAIVEYQYRELAKYWTYTTENGMIVQTFSKEEAEENAYDKKLIEEDKGYKVRFVYFTGNILLDEFDYAHQLNPRKGCFTLTPFVYNRNIIDGTPIGLVHKAKDAQRLLNLKQSKINWLMAARQVRMDKGAVDNVNRLREEVNKPNAIIIKNPGKELVIDNHGQEIAAHYQSIAMHRQEIQDTLGIYDEMLGIETNAQSGVAIARRQNASLTTQVLAQDRFNTALYEVAYKLLGYIQTSYTSQKAAQIIDNDGEVQTLMLDEVVKDENGNERKAFNIKAGAYDVTIEMVPDVASMNEEAEMKLTEIITSNPQVLQNPALFEAVTIITRVPRSKTLDDLFALMKQPQQAAPQKSLGNGMVPVSNDGGATPAVQPTNGMSM